MKIEYGIIIEGGEIVYPLPKELARLQRRSFALMRQRDGRYINRTERDYGKKTNEQMGYYRGVVLPFIHSQLVELGNELTPTKTHRMLKQKFGERETDIIMGEAIETILSLADYKKNHFSAFFEKLNLFSIEFIGSELPPPEKVKSKRKKL